MKIPTKVFSEVYFVNIPELKLVNYGFISIPENLYPGVLDSEISIDPANFASPGETICRGRHTYMFIRV